MITQRVIDEATIVAERRIRVAMDSFAKKFSGVSETPKPPMMPPVPTEPEVKNV
jgi:hypothetical protein